VKASLALWIKPCPACTEPTPHHDSVHSTFTPHASPHLLPYLQGGGLFCNAPAPVQLIASQLANNSAPSGGGIFAGPNCR